MAGPRAKKKDFDVTTCTKIMTEKWNEDQKYRLIDNCRAGMYSLHLPWKQMSENLGTYIGNTNYIQNV